MATSLTRSNPFDVLAPAPSRLWDWFTTPSGLTPLNRLFGEVNGPVPPVDIYETREEVIAAMTVPGLDPGKLDIQVIEDRLTISGEQGSPCCFEPDEEVRQHVQGIPRYGSFSFTFQLPCAVDVEQSQAKYRDGLLCVRFLKAQKPARVRVAVEGGASEARINQPRAVAPQPAGISQKSGEAEASCEPQMADAQPQSASPRKRRSARADSAA